MSWDGVNEKLSVGPGLSQPGNVLGDEGTVSNVPHAEVLLPAQVRQLDVPIATAGRARLLSAGPRLTGALKAALPRLGPSRRHT